MHGHAGGGQRIKGAGRVLLAGGHGAIGGADALGRRGSGGPAGHPHGIEYRALALAGDGGPTLGRVATAKDCRDLRLERLLWRGYSTPAGGSVGGVDIAGPEFQRVAPAVWPLAPAAEKYFLPEINITGRGDDHNVGVLITCLHGM